MTHCSGKRARYTLEMIFRIISAALVSLAAFGQPAPARPEFEVASIRPSAPPAAGQAKVGVHVDGARVICTYLSLKDYIGLAYRVKEYQILGPDWLRSEKFEISATLPAEAAREKVADMMQALLADRFKLKLHRDTKEVPVDGLVAAKGGLEL